MDTSIVVAWLNIFTAPILLIAPFLNSFNYTNMYFKLGMVISGTGLAFQSIVVFMEGDQLSDWGTLWALKDLGLALFAIYAIKTIKDYRKEIKS